MLRYWIYLVNLPLLQSLLSVFALLHGIHRRAHPQDLPTAQALVALVEHGKLGDKQTGRVFAAAANGMLSNCRLCETCRTVSLFSYICSD